MKEIYADFNDIAEDSTLPLSCAGSVDSIAALKDALESGEEVLFSDGEIQTKGQVVRRQDGSWEGQSEWQFSIRK